LCSTRRGATCGPPHTPDHPARRQGHRAGRARGQVQETGGFPTGRRGRKNIFDAAASITAEYRASAAVSAANEASAIITSGFKTSGKFTPAGFASGEIAECSPVKRASSKSQAGRVSNFRRPVFHHATPADQSQRQPEFFKAPPPVEVYSSPPEPFSFPNCAAPFPAGWRPLWRSKSPRRIICWPRVPAPAMVRR